MITQEIIFEKIKNILSVSYPSTNITMDTYLEINEGSHLDMSSLELVQFIIKLEETFNIIIDLDDRFYTIGDAVCGVIKYLEEKKQEKSNEFEL